MSIEGSLAWRLLAPSPKLMTRFNKITAQSLEILGPSARLYRQSYRKGRQDRRQKKPAERIFLDGDDAQEAQGAISIRVTSAQRFGDIVPSRHAQHAHGQIACVIRR
jgi:hypothetical protein